MGYCSFTNEQPLADLLVLQTFTDQCDDFAFSVGKRFDLRDFRVNYRRLIELLDHAAHHRSFDPNFSIVYLENGFEKLIGSMLFQYDSHRAAPYRTSM